MALVARLLDWFWLTSAERVAREPSGGASARVLALSARSAVVREAARRTLRPAEPFAEPGSDAVACELYREAIHWALLAHLELAAQRAPKAASTAVASGTDLADALERADASLLMVAAGGEAELAELRGRLAHASYREFAELAASEQKELAERLGTMSERLLEPLTVLQRRLERVWARRVLHVVLSLALLLGLGWGLLQALSWRKAQSELAAHASWTASSRFPAGGCESPQQHCIGGENYFVHTNQERDPWVIFDLGKERHVSGVEIDNRLDCCLERANPLAIDVSSDHVNWTEVARSTQEFMTLQKSFPSVQARYVKIHVPRPDGILHLSEVRIFP